MNRLRGEITLVLPAATLTLRPTFAALAEIEGKTGHALITLARRLTQGEATLVELQAIIVAGLRGAGAPVPADLPAQMTACGVLPLTEPLLEFLIGALNGTSDGTSHDTSAAEDNSDG